MADLPESLKSLIGATVTTRSTLGKCDWCRGERKLLEITATQNGAVVEIARTCDMCFLAIDRLRKATAPKS
jgi:hypothetical protein